MDVNALAVLTHCCADITTSTGMGWEGWPCDKDYEPYEKASKIPILSPRLPTASSFTLEEIYNGSCRTARITASGSVPLLPGTEPKIVYSP